MACVHIRVNIYKKNLPPLFEAHCIMQYVYVIQNETTKELYIGYTKDLKRRFHEHNAHYNRSTKKNNAKYKLIYYEAFLSQVDTTEREKQLKKFKSSYGQLKKRIKESLNFDEL